MSDADYTNLIFIGDSNNELTVNSATDQWWNWLVTNSLTDVNDTNLWVWGSSSSSYFFLKTIRFQVNNTVYKIANNLLRDGSSYVWNKTDNGISYSYKQYDKMTSTDFSGATNLTEIGNYAFSGSNVFQNPVAAQASDGYYPITMPSNSNISYGNNAFAWCNSNSDIHLIIPYFTGSSTYIFQHGNAKKLTMQHVTSIPSYCFFNNYFRSVHLPRTLQSIASKAFHKDNSSTFGFLTELTIEPFCDLTSIYTDSFKYTDLTNPVHIHKQINQGITSNYYSSSALINNAGGSLNSPNIGKIPNKDIVYDLSFVNTSIVEDQYGVEFDSGMNLGVQKRYILKVRKYPNNYFYQVGDESSITYGTLSNMDTKHLIIDNMIFSLHQTGTYSESDKLFTGTYKVGIHTTSGGSTNFMAYEHATKEYSSIAGTNLYGEGNGNYFVTNASAASGAGPIDANWIDITDGSVTTVTNGAKKFYCFATSELLNQINLNPAGGTHSTLDTVPEIPGVWSQNGDTDTDNDRSAAVNISIHGYTKLNDQCFFGKSSSNSSYGNQILSTAFLTGTPKQHNAMYFPNGDSVEITASKMKARSIRSCVWDVFLKEIGSECFNYTLSHTSGNFETLRLVPRIIAGYDTANWDLLYNPTYIRMDKLGSYPFRNAPIKKMLHFQHQYRVSYGNYTTLYLPEGCFSQCFDLSVNGFLETKGFKSNLNASFNYNTDSSFPFTFGSGTNGTKAFQDVLFGYENTEITIPTIAMNNLPDNAFEITEDSDTNNPYFKCNQMTLGNVDNTGGYFKIPNGFVKTVAVRAASDTNFTKITIASTCTEIGDEAFKNWTFAKWGPESTDNVILPKVSVHTFGNLIGYYSDSVTVPINIQEWDGTGTPTTSNPVWKHENTATNFSYTCFATGFNSNLLTDENVSSNINTFVPTITMNDVNVNNSEYITDLQNYININGTKKMQSFGNVEVNLKHRVKIGNLVQSIDDNTFYESGTNTLGMYDLSLGDASALTYLGEDTIATRYVDDNDGNSVKTLEEFSIPSSLHKLHPRSYYHNSGVLNENNGLLKITNLNNCANLTEIGFGDALRATEVEGIKTNTTITTIPEWAFTYSYWDKDKFDIPSSVTKIVTNAIRFFGQSGQILTLPGSITEVQTNAFDLQNNVSLTVAADGTGTYDGISTSLFNSLSSLTLDLTITGYSKIGNEAFKDKDVFKKVICDDNLTEIGQEAFQYCSKLTEITFNVANVTNIGLRCFDSTELISFNLPTHATYTEILARTFLDNSSLTSITIPAQIQKIGISAFEDCSNLTEIIFASSSAITDIGAEAFKDINANAVMTLNYLDSSDVFADLTTTNIGATDVVLNGMTLGTGSGTINTGNNQYNATTFSSLTNITLDYETVGSGWINDITKIGSVIFSNNVKTIDGNSFHSATNLTSITFGSGITEIGVNSFFGCTNLISVSAFPSSLINIGDGAFRNSGISGTIDLNISSLTDIDQNVFRGCSSLQKVILPDHANYTAIKDYCFSTTGLTELTIPTNVQSIGTQSFESTNFTSLNVPIQCFIIANNAFLSSTIKNAGSTVTLNNIAFDSSSRTTIFGSATVSLNAVNIRSSFTIYPTVGSNTLTIADVDAQLNTWGETGLSGYYINLILDSSIHTLGDNCFNPTSANIPTAVLNALRYIHLSDNTTVIANNVFKDLTGLQSILVKTSLVSIGTGAFHGCSSFRGASFKTNLGDYSGTVKNLLPYDVNYKKIENNTFKECALMMFSDYKTNETPSSLGTNTLINSPYEYYLEPTKIPTQVTEIGDSAFYNAGYVYNNDAFSALVLFTHKDGSNYYDIKPHWNGTSISVGSAYVNNISLKKIGASAFKQPTTGSSDTELKHMVVGPNLTEIGANAFENCAYLETFSNIDPKGYIEINPVTTSLGANAFLSSDAMTKVRFIGTNLTALQNAFPTTYTNNLSKFEASYFHSSNSSQGSDYTGNITYDISFQSGVTSIADNAYQNETKLTAVTYISSITEIGQNAFDGCTSLVNIDFGNTSPACASSSFLATGAFTNGAISGITYNFPTDFNSTLWTETYFSSGLQIPLTLPTDPTSIVLTNTDLSSLSNFDYIITIREGVTQLSIDSSYLTSKTIIQINFPTTLTTVSSNAFNGVQVTNPAPYVRIIGSNPVNDASFKNTNVVEVVDLSGCELSGFATAVNTFMGADNSNLNNIDVYLPKFTSNMNINSNMFNWNTGTIYVHPEDNYSHNILSAYNDVSDKNRTNAVVVYKGSQIDEDNFVKKYILKDIPTAKPLSYVSNGRIIPSNIGAIIELGCWIGNNNDGTGDPFAFIQTVPIISSLTSSEIYTTFTIDSSKQRMMYISSIKVYPGYKLYLYGDNSNQASAHNSISVLNNETTIEFKYHSTSLLHDSKIYDNTNGTTIIGFELEKTRLLMSNSPGGIITPSGYMILLFFENNLVYHRNV